MRMNRAATAPAARMDQFQTSRIAMKSSTLVISIVGENRDAVGRGKVVGLAEADREAERHDHQEPVHCPDMDLAVALFGRLLDGHVRQPAELDRLAGHRIGAGDDRLAGDHCRDRRHHDQWRQQSARAEAAEDVAVGRRARKHDRRLAGIIEDKRWNDDKVPRKLHRPRAEMAYIGIERLGPRHAEEDASEHEKALKAAAHQIVEAGERVDGHPDVRMLQDPVDSEGGDYQEPGQHDESEGAADPCSAERLDGEQQDQDNVAAGNT
jgi:hypothetical protein